MEKLNAIGIWTKRYKYNHKAHELHFDILEMVGGYYVDGGVHTSEGIWTHYDLIVKFESIKKSEILPFNYKVSEDDILQFTA